jgi:chloramphenicol-sensitive protein RarD
VPTSTLPALPALPAKGIGFAVGCYVGWGVVPIYWKGIIDIPASEALIPRILWTLVAMWIAAIITGRGAENWTRSKRDWVLTAISAVLIALNWGVFVYAVQHSQIVATSLGYYITPLMSILLGLFVLGERLTRVHAAATALAGLGVLTMALREGEVPWISLMLAVTFSLYGLVQKLHPQPPLAGLTREMMLLTPIAILGLGHVLTQSDSTFAQASVSEHAYLALSGVITAVPLLLFHAATRYLPLVAVGMFQYIGPTITLAVATFLFKENFSPTQAMGFGLVWVGLMVFFIDSIRRLRTAPSTESQSFASS